MPCPAGLHVCRIDPWQRALEIEPHAVCIKPSPQILRVAVCVCYIDGTSVSVATGRDAASMQRVADMSMVSCCQALAIVVPEPAQDRPTNSRCVHGAAGPIEKLTEVTVHTGDHVISQGHSQACRCRNVFPCEIAALVPLYRGSLVDFP